MNGSAGGIMKHNSTNLSLALLHTENGRLSNRATPSPQFLAPVLIGFAPADISRIRFHNALKQDILARLARVAYALEHVPRRVLRHPNLLGKLQGGDAFALGEKEIDGHEPFLERNV